MSAIRTIFVTGANQGLGMHTVHQLASTPGVLVFMGARKLAAAKESLSKFASDVHPSSSVVPIQLDLTDAASIKNAHDAVAKHLQEKNLKGLDVLVNNAAVASGTPEAIYATNVIGTAAFKDAMYPLLPQRTGAILNVSSGLGSNALFAARPSRLPPTYLFYSSSKAALNSLTVQWALQEEQKGSGIRVVSICPGFNATNLNGYAEGAGSPADGCKVIVKEALTKEGGKTAAFLHKDGEYPW